MANSRDRKKVMTEHSRWQRHHAEPLEWPQIEGAGEERAKVPQHVLDRLQAIKRRVLDRIAERAPKTPDPQQDRQEP
jgi:hypothetical protein